MVGKVTRFLFGRVHAIFAQEGSYIRIESRPQLTSTHATGSRFEKYDIFISSLIKQQ